MKRLAILLLTSVMAIACFGCTSNEPSQPESSSSSAEASVDQHGFNTPVAEPPIPCTKKAEIGNVSIMVPEEWEARVGVGGYLKIASENGVTGSMNVDESDMNASNSDEELSAFMIENRDRVVNEGFTVEDEVKVERNGDLAYIILPFTSTQTYEDGETTDFWGYSFCGYDNELITADLSCTEENKEILETFRWILENVQVS